MAMKKPIYAKARPKRLGKPKSFNKKSKAYKAVKRKRMSQDDFERTQRSISAQLDYTGFKKTDLVIEAVVENMNVKKAVF